MNVRRSLLQTTTAFRSAKNMPDFRDSDWYVDGHMFNYARKIDITEQSGTSLSGYQVQITFGAGDPIFSNSDGTDLRFTTIDGETTYTYWVENFDATNETASVWVKVPDLPASGTEELLLFYGSKTAPDASDASATFVMYDAFDDGALNGWSITSGTGGVSGGNLVLDYNSNGDSAATYSLGRTDAVRAECRWYVHYDNGNGEGGPGLRHDGSSNRNAIYMGKGHGGDDRLRDGHDSTTIDSNTGPGRSTNTETWMKKGMVAVDGGYAEGRVRDSEPLVSGTGANNPGSSNLWFYAWKTQIEVDWIRVREYASTEPSVSVGGELAA